MKICGLKFTHDGSIAVIENNTLLFSTEMEKINNNPRHQDLSNLDQVQEVLASEGIQWQQIDQFAVDGWGDLNNSSDRLYKMWISQKGVNEQIELAAYGHLVNKQDLLGFHNFNCQQLSFSYNSYMHVSGHIFGAYCSSPFIQDKEDSFVLIWDGGMSPQLFYIRHDSAMVEPLRPIFNLDGNCYAAFAQQYPPFDKTEKYDLAVAGKVMAYIALGKREEPIQQAFWNIYNENRSALNLSLALIRALVEWGKKEQVEAPVMIANFHYFLSDLLVSSLHQKIKQYPGYTPNICFAGGCGLNIKWNSAIRNSGLFKRMWVPPFPNDAGSALGAACCEMVRREGMVPLKWDVYCGPQFNAKGNMPGWRSMPCTAATLAYYLHITGEPVLVLHHRAEIGPRALGNRSIVASPSTPAAKDLLNNLKRREAYRPVAPICIEEDAPRFFDPGTPDPYMLFDHAIRPEYLQQIPAVAHLDGSARLQTVNERQNPLVYELLREMKTLTGIPVLCNTSANLLGSGFFPDLESAMQWGKVNMIWDGHQLHYRAGYEVYFRKEDAPVADKEISKEYTIVKL